MRIMTASTSTSRVGLYVRVSSEEQVQGYSLDAQTRTIEAWCAQHGHEIVARYRDEGKSARTDNLDRRPAFKQMLVDAESGRFDVVVVHKLDRFARNLLVALETLQRLERRDVGFVSLSEQMDFTTPIGKVILATLAAFAQYYSDNLATEVRKGKGERKQQGLYNGVLPFGATKGEDGVPIPHLVAHAGLHLAFELAAAGKTDREVAQALTAAGYRTTGNRGANPFTKDTVRVILQNRFYLGELPDGQGDWVPGKHQPLIESELFARAQAARAANTKKPIRQGQNYRPWALSGLATCANCGESITVHGRPDGRKRVRCAGRGQGNVCTAPTFFADLAEEQLGGVLQRFAIPEAEREPLLILWRRANCRDGDTAATRSRLERKVARLQEVYLDGDLDRATYQRQKADLHEQLAALPMDREPDDATAERLAGFLADVASAWTVATPEERNRLARQLLSGAVVENKTVVAVVPRPEMAPFFQVVALEDTDAAPDPGSGVYPDGVSAEATGVGSAPSIPVRGPGTGTGARLPVPSGARPMAPFQLAA
jgi:site-specific DNA recombinase